MDLKRAAAAWIELKLGGIDAKTFRIIFQPDFILIRTGLPRRLSSEAFNVMSSASAEPLANI